MLGSIGCTTEAQRIGQTCLARLGGVLGRLGSTCCQLSRMFHPKGGCGSGCLRAHESAGCFRAALQRQLL